MLVQIGVPGPGLIVRPVSDVYIMPCTLALTIEIRIAAQIMTLT